MMKKILDYFIPKTVVYDVWSERKLRLFISVSLVSALYAILYLPTSIMEEYYEAEKVIIFFFVCNVLFPFLLKINVPLKILANCYILVLAISLSLIMSFSGAVWHTATDPQLMVLAPVIALLFLNYRAAIIWFCVAVTILAVFGILQLYGVNFEVKMNYKYIQLQNLLAVCGHLLLVFMVINIFEKQKNIALKQLEEKNTLLEDEKRRSDNLLLNILPHEIAEELKRDGKSKTRQYDQVSVLFTDFVSFTSVSEQLSPSELVDEINIYFSAFDAIIEKNGLEKIKTIGDAYLAVCGMPNETEKHAHHTVNAAIEIMEFMNRHETEGGKFKIRIGINSGTVVAGIVGIKKFAYDIWGDTVNTAARMEEKSKSGKINISGSTYELVKNDFTCDYRGKIEAKNKGEIDMYFIETILPVSLNDSFIKMSEGQAIV